MVSMVLSCARCCHRKFLLKSTSNNWINMAHICIHIYICRNVLSGVGDGVVVDVSLLCLCSLYWQKQEDGNEFYVYLVCLCAPNSENYKHHHHFQHCFPARQSLSLLVITNTSKHTHIQYPISKTKISMVREERTSKRELDADANGATNQNRNGDREGGVLRQQKLWCFPFNENEMENGWDRDTIQLTACFVHACSWLIVS